MSNIIQVKETNFDVLYQDTFKLKPPGKGDLDLIKNDVFMHTKQLMNTMMLGDSQIKNIYRILFKSDCKDAFIPDINSQDDTAAVIYDLYKTQKSITKPDAIAAREKIAYHVGGDFAGVLPNSEDRKSFSTLPIDGFDTILKSQQLDYRRIVILRLFLLDRDIGFRNILIDNETTKLIPGNFDYILPLRFEQGTRCGQIDRSHLPDHLDKIPFTDEERAFIGNLSPETMEIQLSQNGISPRAINNQRVALAALQAAIEVSGEMNAGAEHPGITLDKVFNFVYGNPCHIYATLYGPRNFGTEFKQLCERANQGESFDSIKQEIIAHFLTL